MQGRTPIIIAEIRQRKDSWIWSVWGLTSLCIFNLQTYSELSLCSDTQRRYSSTSQVCDELQRLFLLFPCKYIRSKIDTNISSGLIEPCAISGLPVSGNSPHPSLSVCEYVFPVNFYVCLEKPACMCCLTFIPLWFNGLCNIQLTAWVAYVLLLTPTVAGVVVSSRVIHELQHIPSTKPHRLKSNDFMSVWNLCLSACIHKTLFIL